MKTRYYIFIHVYCSFDAVLEVYLWKSNPNHFISLIQLNPAGVSKPTCQTPVQMQALLISHHSPSSPGHTTKMVWYVSEYDFLNGLMSIHFRKKKGASRCWDTPTEKERNRMKIMETEPKKKTHILTPKNEPKPWILFLWVLGLYTHPTLMAFLDLHVCQDSLCWSIASSAVSEWVNALYAQRH